MIAAMTSLRWVVLGLLVATAGCAGELVDVGEPEDLAHPSLPADADLPDDADVPLLPTLDDDAGPADDAALSAPDAPPDVAADAPRDVAADVPRDVAADVTPRCTGSASGQSSLWTCTANRGARQRCVAGAVQTEACAHGCVAQPSGTHDYCAAAPPPAPAGLPTCARRPLLRWGLHPDASDRLRCAGVPAARITQTIGYAAASAGTHGPDGSVGGAQYSAATDISTRGLAAADVRTLLGRLANQGFAAWYRWPGHDGWPSSEAPHIHAIYVGCAMKSSLRAQVRAWLVGRNGLVSNTLYGFYTWTDAQRALLRTVFYRYN